MRVRILPSWNGALATALLVLPAVVAAQGDAERGATAFRACAACHSLEADEHLTGPSLAGFWERKAGTAKGFGRYSEALKRTDIVWRADTLDKWLENPAAYIPGNTMTYPGLRASRERRDLIAYLRAVSEGKAAAAAEPARGGMMMGGSKVDLKKARPAGQVVSIRYCGDAYTVKTADGKESKVWEFNLRFKPDSSDLGPRPGQPMVVGAGMRGDRASVVFAAPDEISKFIDQSCD